MFRLSPLLVELISKTASKELEQTFVEKVLVFDAEHIKITWKFEDVFAAIEAME